MRPDVETLLDEIQAWATVEPGVVGLALVGSHARGAAGPDSDVDLILICAAPDRLLVGKWYSRFGEAASVTQEDYGALQSLRVHFRNGPEVEFGLTDPSWARIPLDAGTRAVLCNGVRVLYDPEDLLGVAAAAAGAR